MVLTINSYHTRVTSACHAELRLWAPSSGSDASTSCGSFRACRVEISSRLFLWHNDCFLSMPVLLLSLDRLHSRSLQAAEKLQRQPAGWMLVRLVSEVTIDDSPPPPLELYSLPSYTRPLFVSIYLFMTVDCSTIRTVVETVKMLVKFDHNSQNHLIWRHVRRQHSVDETPAISCYTWANLARPRHASPELMRSSEYQRMPLIWAGYFSCGFSVNREAEVTAKTSCFVS